MLNYLVLIRERFNPLEYIPMIVVFVLANGLAFSPAPGQDPTQNWVVAFLLALSFFLRLRFFDEIKDYETDLKLNPHRPLARGAISISEVKTGIFWLLVFEISLCLFLDPRMLLTHALAIGFSLLMYSEFFIGDFLRPKLTTYAVTHTFSSVLIALSVTCAVTGLSPLEITRSQLLFLLMNWAFFNLFEFARKTFAPMEERDSVPSYSKIFTPAGAVLLSWSQGILGVFLIWYSLRDYAFVEQARLMWPAATLMVYILLSSLFMFKPLLSTARIFRLGSGVYLLSHYVVLILVLAR
ncbi:MAG: UbiA family prenyltransferase [Bdellovibrionaceae bacterium]|nr:UbiA family prenyltransferase [Pseudobdellovibrionaceae bacterium]